MINRFICWWQHNVRIRWVRLYRWLFQGKWVDPTSRLRGRTPRELELFFGGCRWRADSWRQAFDAIDYPGKFFSTRKGDCDEYASFALHTLEGMDAKYMLTYSMRPLKKSHAVCAWEKDGEWFHISNYKNGEPQGPFDDLDAVLLDLTLGRGDFICATLRNEKFEEVKDIQPCFGGCS